jgi:hypothetical protein
MKDKFSVVIPTMWVSDFIYELLDVLESSHHIGEIILIDNDKSKRPAQIVNTDKIRIIEQEENIYVNPAWNLGVELSKFDNLCISNDDLVWNTDILPFILDNIHLGVIGQSTSNYYNDHEELGLHPMGIRPWGWGCCFFLTKENWLPIPEGLKIACGDDYLVKHIPPFELKGNKLKVPPHPWSVSRTSSKNEFTTIQEEDVKLFKSL